MKYVLSQILKSNNWQISWHYNIAKHKTKTMSHSLFNSIDWNQANFILEVFSPFSQKFVIVCSSRALIQKGNIFLTCFLWKFLRIFPLPCSCDWLWRRKWDSSPWWSTLGSCSSRIWTTCLEGITKLEEPGTLNIKKIKKIKWFWNLT